jgi:hypothetical protein
MHRLVLALHSDVLKQMCSSYMQVNYLLSARTETSAASDTLIRKRPHRDSIGRNTTKTSSMHFSLTFTNSTTATRWTGRATPLI